MVEHNNGLDTIFSSLADPTRRDILHKLRLQERTVGELADKYDLSFAAVSKHLKVLERANLVTKRRSGRQQFVRIEPNGLRQADSHLKQYRELWEKRMDRLGTLLQDKK